MPLAWEKVREFEDIKYERAEGIAKITINRPEVRNAFRPETIFELQEAFSDVREDPSTGVVLLTGEGPDAFCSGGDQRIRGDGGYVDPRGVPRLNVLDLQRQIRLLPKPVIAIVAGYAIGGGHVLHVVCDLTIAADNARFGQTGPRVGSFDAGYGSTLLARLVGDKKAKEIWFLCRQYSAQEALDMGLVNAVVPLAELEDTAVQWAREILEKSPTAIRFIKAAFNAATEGLAGLQQFAGDATLLYYLTDEAKEGKNAFLEHVRDGLKFLEWAPVHFVSAKTGEGVQKLFGKIREVYESASRRVGTGELNRFVERLRYEERKIYYITQASIRPPTFVLFTNRNAPLHFSDERYLANQLRKAFGFQGTPVVIRNRGKENRGKEKARP